MTKMPLLYSGPSQLPTKVKGFTLLEALVVLVIAAILVSIAVPSYNDSISKSKVNSPYKSLRSSIALAKTEAVSRNRQVVICASTDQASCGTDWNKGWLVFVDTNKNKSYDAAGKDGALADEIIGTGVQLSSGVELKLVDNAGNKASKMIFTRQGYATGTSGDFIFCSKYDENGADDSLNSRAIIVLESGVVRMSTDGTDEGSVHEDRNGKNISC